MINDMLIRFAVSCPVKGITILPPWYKYLEAEDASKVPCSPKFVFPDDIGKILLAIAEILLRVGGLVAVGFVIYGGFKYILSQGQPENAANALKTIINALIGVGIAVSATFIVNLVGGNLL